MSGNTSKRVKHLEYRRNKVRGSHREWDGTYTPHSDMSTNHLINTIAVYLESEAQLLRESTPKEAVRIIQGYGLLESVYDMADEIQGRL